jgi:hypothetical protein
MTCPRQRPYANIMVYDGVQLETLFIVSRVAPTIHKIPGGWKNANSTITVTPSQLEEHVSFALHMGRTVRYVICDAEYREIRTATWKQYSN